MIKSGRGNADKGISAKNFRHNVGKTHKRNVLMQPRRGGWRL